MNNSGKIVLRIRDFRNRFLADPGKQSGSIEEYLIDALTWWTLYYITEICWLFYDDAEKKQSIKLFYESANMRQIVNIYARFKKSIWFYYLMKENLTKFLYLDYKI